MFETGRNLLSFPTRRSSDLRRGAGGRPPPTTRARRFPSATRARAGSRTRRWRPPRSEEHTSELQSHVNLVCRLLLEKKNPDPLGIEFLGAPMTVTADTSSTT